MTKTTSRVIRLVSRLSGVPTADNFTLEQVELNDLQEGHVLMRDRFLSVIVRL